MALNAKAVVWMILFTVGTATLASAQCVEPPAGRIAWWTGDGTPADAMQTGHGTLQGGTDFDSGMVMQAFSFDGVDGYVDVDEGLSLRPEFPFTADFWMRKDSASDFYAISHTEIENNGLYSGFRVYVNGAGAVVSGVGNNLGCCSPEYRRNFFTADGTVSLNVWHHVAVVFESATSHQIYVDGSLREVTEEGEANSMTFGANSRLQIGRSYDPNFGAFHYGKGMIDELELHSGSIDPSMIEAIFMAGSDGKCGKIVVATDSAHWGMLKASFGHR